MKKSLIVLVSLAALLAATGGLASVVDLNEVKKFDRQVYVGSNVELECDLKNYYDSVISWRKLVGRMSDDSEELADGRLIIYDVSKEDAGEYECFNPANGDSRRMRLIVLQSHSADTNGGGGIGNLRQVQSKYKSDVEAPLGASIELYCEFKDEPDIEWKKVDGEIGPHKTIYGAPDNRLALHFLSEEDEGIYECILPDGTSSRINLKLSNNKSGINDDVFKSNTDDYNNDYQLENIKTIYADLGSDVRFVCDLPEYNNGGELNWRKIAGVISDNSQINENRLEIDDVSQDDTGIYECSSENLNSMKFHLIVNSQQPTTDRITTRASDSSWEDDDSHSDQPRTTTEQNGIIPDDPVDSFVTIPIGGRAELVCALKVPSQDIEWIKLDEEINYEKVTAFDNKLVIDNLERSDAGVYQCNSLTTRSAHRTRLEVIERVYPTLNRTVLQTDYRRNNGYQYCNEDEATCRNGQCIPKSVLCNGQNDCADGSDENNCGVSGSGYIGKCQPNEKPCRADGKCIPKFWFCDGERECSDGSDEESCTGPSPGGICRPYEFMCKNRNQCIYKSFLCDNERDCTDGSDETGCVEPKVVQPPIRYLTVCLGATFKLECRANGFPVPFINWRLNWGHVCPEPRCWMVTDEIGHGTFTVTDARWEDAGAYSCEAINSKGREFAIPDAIVRIEPCTPPPTTTTTTTTTTTPADFEEECMCYGHAEACTCSNECYRCQHNTTGRHCEECLPGYHRDPSRPGDLWAYCYREHYIPPPTTQPPRPTTTTPLPIIVDDDDCFTQCHNHSECTCNMQCYECRDNTWGDRCQYCKPGYVGDATQGTPYDCQPSYQSNNQNRLQALVATTRAHNLNIECNQFGTAQIIDGNCKCKPGVVGAVCDQCAPKFFHLVEQKAHKRGCISCFCNGLEVDCESSRSHYTKLAAKFDGSEQEQWQISDRFIETKFELEVVDQGVEFTRFNEFNNLEMYILVPNRFKGNKLASYGGNLTFELTVKSQSESASELKPVEIRISGAHVNIVHKSEIPIQLNEDTKISISLVEDSFKRYGDNGRVDRDHLMMALSDIRIVMIRASYMNNQESIRLSNFSWDIASDNNQENEDQEEGEEQGAEAKAVEVCQCPQGYTGNSCENCAPGYERSRRGFYLGLCEPI